MVEDAKVDSGTISTTRSAENLSASVDMAEDAEVGNNDDGGDDKTVKKITSFQKCRADLLEHLTFQRSEKRQVSLNSFGYG